jgi:hypothetical protein
MPVLGQAKEAGSKQQEEDKETNRSNLECKKSSASATRQALLVGSSAIVWVVDELTVIRCLLGRINDPEFCCLPRLLGFSDTITRYDARGSIDEELAAVAGKELENRLSRFYSTY